MKDKSAELREVGRVLVALLRACSWKEYLLLLLFVSVATAAGVELATLGSHLESVSHGDAADFAQYRLAGNRWIGGLGGFMMGTFFWLRFGCSSAVQRVMED